MTAGIENKYRNNNDKEIREALNEENLKLYEQLTDSLIMQNPDRAETISQNAAYLQRFVKDIGICKKTREQITEDAMHGSYRSLRNVLTLCKIGSPVY